MNKELTTDSICSINKNILTCPLCPCSECGWSYKEIERRRKLPLIEFPNGLYGKDVTKPRRNIEEN